ncbi:MAG: beta strand repeat-containing protein [Luteolibacter sp.]
MKHKKHTLFFSAIALTGMATTASAAPITWTGAGDGTTYEDGVNWGGSAPTNDLLTDIATFNGDNVDLSATQQVGGLDFAVGNTLSGTGSIEVGTSGIAVSGDSAINTAGLVLNSGTSITLNGTLDIGADLSGTGDLTFTAGSATALSLTGTGGDDNSTNYTGNVIFDGVDVTLGRYALGGIGGGDLSLLNGATISANNHLQLGSKNIAISGGAQINQFGSNNVYNFNGVISGTGGLTFGHVGGGNNDKIQLDGTANTFTGGLTIDAVDVHSQGAGSLGDAANVVTIKNGGFLNMLGGDHIDNRSIVLEGTGNKIQNNGGWNYTNSGGITGTGSVELVGDGDEWTWNDAFENSYSGGTTIDNIGIRVRGGTGTNSSLGSGAITLKNGAFLKNYRNRSAVLANDIVIDSTGAGIESGWRAGDGVQLEGVITGDGLLTVRNDSGRTQLKNANNSYTGGTEIQGTVWAVGGALGTGDITLNNIDGSRGHLQNNGGGAVHTNNLIIAANGGRMQAGWTTGALEIQGVVSGSGDLTIVGDSEFVHFSNTGNTFSGDISLQDATSRLTVASLGGGTYGGVISGDAGATLTITDDLTLSGVSTFAGTTNAAGGSLIISGSSSSTAITVDSGAAIGGPGSTTGDLTVAAGGQFVFSLTDTLTVGGTVSLDSTFGVDDLVGLSSATSDGTYTLIDGTATSFAGLGIENFGAGNAFDLGSGKSAYFEDGSLQLVVTSIPEPSTALLGALSLLALFRRRRA